MQEIVIEITQDGMYEALAALDRADDDAAYAESLKARLIAYHSDKDDPMLNAMRVLVAHALTNPDGKVRRILFKRSFLVPELTSGYDFKTGSH